jgi:phosphoribosylformylglycinamidine (FGAM) synthase-like enzyme
MKPRGATLIYNARLERDFISRAIACSRKSEIKKSARVIAGGGLAVALAKEVISSGVGMTIEIAGANHAEILFGEGGPRAVYIIPRSAEEKFLACWEGYPTTHVGHIGGDKLIVKDIAEISVSDLVKAFFG